MLILPFLLRFGISSIGTTGILWLSKILIITSGTPSPKFSIDSDKIVGVPVANPYEVSTLAVCPKYPLLVTTYRTFALLIA